jgi:hypothetical protein
LASALGELADTAYGHDVHAGQTLRQAGHALGATLLWHLRVLAGWLPRGGADTVRLLAAGFEIANVDEHVDGLATGRDDSVEPISPYRLGALTTSWTRLAGTTSLAELREQLRASAWGDPGEASADAVRVGMRLSWAGRLAAAEPDTDGWCTGAGALLVARLLPLTWRRPPEIDWLGRSLLGPDVWRARTVTELADRLPRTARWALADLPSDAGAAELWRAEAAWWRRVEDDGFRLLHRSALGPHTILGAVAVLGADVWRVRAALEVAARGGAGLEAFDAVA